MTELNLFEREAAAQVLAQLSAETVGEQGALAVGEGVRWALPFALPSAIAMKGSAALPVALDNGNDAAKVALPAAADGRLITLRVPTAFTEARTIRSGEREVTFAGDGLHYWIGDTALRHDGQELPIGSTATRLADDRMRLFIAAVLVEALHTAGYAAGVHTVALGLSIPDDEIERSEDTKNIDTINVRKDTKQAVATHIRGRALVVTRIGRKGESETWTVQVVGAMTLPQTAGTVNLYTKAFNGRPIIDRDRLIVLNIGGGDTFQSEVSTRPFQMTSRRVSPGTVDIARALWRRLGETERNDAAAQSALRTKKALIAGRWTNISDEIAAVMRSQGQTLTTRVLADALSTRLFVLITGGGCVFWAIRSKAVCSRQNPRDNVACIML